MDTERIALIAGVVIFFAAVIYIWFFRKDQFTAYAEKYDRGVPTKVWQGAECDFGCNSREYTDLNPFVKICQQRPSDHADMCCVMWGHADCAGAPVGTLPQIGETGGVATPDQWEDWIESPDAAKKGYCFLT